MALIRTCHTVCLLLRPLERQPQCDLSLALTGTSLERKYLHTLAPICLHHLPLSISELGQLAMLIAHASLD